MRIAYVTETYPPDLNGVSLTVERTVAYLRDRGHGVDLVRPAQPGESRGPCEDEWRSAGWPIPMYPEMRFGFEWPAVLARRFKATRTQLVHVATEGPLGRAAIVAARRVGLPVTSDFRTNFHHYSRYYRLGWMEPVISRYLRAFHNATDRTFVPSEQSRRELRGRGFERTLVAGRGVDMVRFSPQHRDPALRLAWGAADGPVLLYVGRLAAEKNVTLALRAYRQVRETHRGARMIVAGDGPCAQALRRDFPDVRFLGSQTGHALAATYASADLFVFPSESETFGNVTLEALASGLPVVAFDHAAAGELVTHGVNGWLVSPADAEGFVAACCAMTDSLDASRSASRAARRSVASHHWNRVLRAFEHQLTDALHEAGRSRVAETVTARA